MVIVSRDALFGELNTATVNTCDDSWNNEKNNLQLEVEPEKVAGDSNNDSTPTEVEHNCEQIQ